MDAAGNNALERALKDGLTVVSVTAQGGTSKNPGFLIVLSKAEL